MEKLLEYVEMHGLYTEGIYRKSGAANRMKELKQCLQAGKGQGHRLFPACLAPAALPLLRVAS